MSQKDKKITNIEVLPLRPDREKILDILSENIQIMNQKVKNNRIHEKNLEKEKVKITQMKAVVYACKTYNDILKDLELDKIQQELKFIKTVAISEDNTTNKEKLAEDVSVVEETIEKLNAKGGK